MGVTRSPMPGAVNARTGAVPALAWSFALHVKSAHAPMDITNFTALT